MPTLQQFLEANQSLTRRCKVCQLPSQLLEQIDENNKLGRPVGHTLLLAWLAGEGVSISRHNLRTHQEHAA